METIASSTTLPQEVIEIFAGGMKSSRPTGDGYVREDVYPIFRTYRHKIRAVLRVIIIFESRMLSLADFRHYTPKTSLAPSSIPVS